MSQASSTQLGILKQLDNAWARIEAGLAGGLLLLMIVVAFAQAFLRNLTQHGFQWANAGLAWLDWADFILSKGTLGIAFLGASLAVHTDKHVAIDIMRRYVGPRTRLALSALVGIVSCVICIFLARAFWHAVMVNSAEIPMEFDVITPTGNVHLCDATPEQLLAADRERSSFCVVRSLLRVAGPSMGTPGAAFQLVVPVSFSVMALRFLGVGIRDARRLARGEVDDEHALHGEELAAQEVSDAIKEHDG
jgi:TRAP-type C4-dicarboxylate transport system permease small subunit